MIKALLQLSSSEMDDIMRLMAIAEASDSAAVTLQIDKSLNFFPDMKSWFLAYDQHDLIGVLSIFQPLEKEAEITGCVHPAHRRAGIFNMLYETAEKELIQHRIERLLFALDRRSESGRQMMLKKKYTHLQTEYSMDFPMNKKNDLLDKVISIKRLHAEMLGEMAAISAAAFHETMEDAVSMLANCLNSKDREQYGAFQGDELVGIVSVHVCDGSAMINGLAISPEFQRKGYGRNFMLHLLDLLTDRELKITLDVNSENAVAYALYRQMGFQESKVQDYYETHLSPVTGV